MLKKLCKVKFYAHIMFKMFGLLFRLIFIIRKLTSIIKYKFPPMALSKRSLDIFVCTSVLENSAQVWTQLDLCGMSCYWMFRCEQHLNKLYSLVWSLFLQKSGVFGTWAENSFIMCQYNQFYILYKYASINFFFSRAKLLFWTCLCILLWVFWLHNLYIPV